MNAHDLIDCALEQNPTKFQDAFNEIMANKVAAAIDAKRVEVAQAYFNVPTKSEGEV